MKQIVCFVIHTPINAYHIDTTGGTHTLILYHEDGSESRIPGDPQNPAQFTDTQGNIYTVDKEGNISKYNAENTAAASAESTQSPSDIFFLINLYDMYHGIRKYYYITHKKEAPSPEEIQALKQLKKANPKKIRKIEDIVSIIDSDKIETELKKTELFKDEWVYIAIEDQIILNEYFFFTGNKADILLYDKNIPEFNHELHLRRLLAHELKHIEFEFANPLSFIRWAVLRKYSITNRETDKHLEKIKLCDDHKSNKGNQACIHCSEGEAHEKHNPEGQACCQRACDAVNP